MSSENFVEKLASQLGQSATVKNVYGEPVIRGDKTVIPVAQIAYGFGGGYGYGKKKGIKDKDAATGKGSGGGGGMYAKPKGIYEITPTGTRFIPATNTRTLLVGVAIGFLLKGFFFRKKNNKK